MTWFALLKLLERPKSRKELLRITKLPERTLRYKLSKLKKMGYVKELIDLKDMRRKKYVKA